jgi:hypothetical protein
MLELENSLTSISALWMTTLNRAMNLSNEPSSSFPFSQMVVAHSNDRPVSREMTVATLEHSVVGAPV